MIKNLFSSIGCLTIVLGLTGSILRVQGQESWPSFLNGGRSATTAKLPSHWDPSSITWQVELDGYGQSSPIIMKDSAIVTTVAGPMKEVGMVSCFDLATGGLRWRHSFPTSQQAASNYMASRAAPTPLADEEGVYAFFESGDLLALDWNGNLRWSLDLAKTLGPFDNNHGLGSSPAQDADRLFVNIEHRGPSHLIAVSKRDGKTVWKVDRPSSSSWSSPMIVPLGGGRSTLVISSGGRVDGYSIEDGKLSWSKGGLEGNSVASATFQKNRLFVAARAAEFSDESVGVQSNLCLDLSRCDPEPAVAWKATKVVSDYASPVANGDEVYYLNKAGVVFCLDVNSGSLHYANRLGTQCWATPIISNGLIYYFGRNGATVVVKAGKEWDEVATNWLWKEDSPPKPDIYKENNQPRSEGEGTSRANQSADGQPGGPRGPRGRSGGMAARLATADKDMDGKLTGDEIPSELRESLSRIDTDGDGSLDQKEQAEMVAKFNARRADSQEGSRDPIVYGAAAVDHRIVIRTGTRLYCISDSTK